MEKLNLLLNMVIIAYILVKEFGNITKSIKKTSKNIKKYITAVKKQLSDLLKRNKKKNMMKSLLKDAMLLLEVKYALINILL